MSKKPEKDKHPVKKKPAVIQKTKEETDTELYDRGRSIGVNYSKNFGPDLTKYIEGYARGILEGLGIQ